MVGCARMQGAGRRAPVAVQEAGLAGALQAHDARAVLVVIVRMLLLGSRGLTPQILFIPY